MPEDLALSKIWGLSVYYKSCDLVILRIHFPYIEICKLLKNGVYIIITFSWCADEGFLQKFRSYLPVDYDINRYVFVLGNTEEECKLFRNAGFKNVQIWNNACFLNGAFISKEWPPLEGKRRYSAVLNSKLAGFKNHHLTFGCKHVAYVTYKTPYLKGGRPVHGQCNGTQICEYCHDGPFNLDILKSCADPTSKVFLDLPHIKVCDILDCSRVGLILSEKEGACYASTEYLCRGLPVISLKSLGGRDAFYNERNSIICNNDPVDVQNAIVRAHEMLDDGRFSRKDIRRDALEKVRQFRNQFVGITRDIFKDVGKRDIDAEKYFSDFSRTHVMSMLKTTDQDVRDAIHLLGVDI